MPWNETKPPIYIGIDCGTNTGIAVWNAQTKQFEQISTTMIHRAMEMVANQHTTGRLVKVIVEDARQVRFNTSPEKAQGAGYVKAHAQIWEAFLTDRKIAFEMKRPNKAITKMDKSLFARTTKYTGLTSNHGRDAAMLVFQK